MHRYSTLKEIHSGQNSKITLARSKSSNGLVVLKFTKVEELKSNETDSLMELNQHPNIARFVTLFCDLNELVIVMEYYDNGDLHHFIESFGPLCETDAHKYFTQTAEALGFAHSHRIAHRDVKLENIFLDSQKNVKLGDWGLSFRFDPLKHITDSCGSPHFAAPEVWAKLGYIGPELDSWGLGICLYGMLSGTLPFMDKDVVKLKQKIISAKIKRHRSISSKPWDLIKQLLNQDRNQRLSVERSLFHPWIQSVHKRPRYTQSEMTLSVDEQFQTNILTSKRITKLHSDTIIHNPSNKFSNFFLKFRKTDGNKKKKEIATRFGNQDR